MGSWTSHERQRSGISAYKGAETGGLTPSWGLSRISPRAMGHPGREQRSRGLGLVLTGGFPVSTDGKMTSHADTRGIGVHKSWEQRLES